MGSGRGLTECPTKRANAESKNTCMSSGGKIFDIFGENAGPENIFWGPHTGDLSRTGDLRNGCRTKNMYV